MKNTPPSINLWGVLEVMQRPPLQAGNGSHGLMISQINNKTTPRVSVLMTIYNADPYLRLAIDSVIAQTFTDWELIAVENGSTDKSPSYLKEYSDARVKVFPFSKNIGRTTALRFAFNQALGDYIAVLDADDISAPDRLERQVDFLDQNPDVGLVGSWTQYIDERGRVFDEFKPTSNQEELQDCLGWTNPIMHSSAMYRRQAALQAGGYPKDIAVGQDFGLTLAMAQSHMIAIIEDFLCQIRIVPGSMSSSEEYRALHTKEKVAQFRLAADSLRLSAKSRRLNRHAIAINEIRLGIILIRNKSIFAGLTMIIKGIVAAPSILWRNGLVMRFFGAKLEFRG